MFHPHLGGLSDRDPGEEAGCLPAHQGELVPVGRVDEGFSGREVPVERADTDTRLLGDSGRRGVQPLLGEDLRGDRVTAAVRTRG
ncbi:hypothetical protein Stube_03740 [Streptomyces tubercidicus]|uniref:Uncharacterized protein n=1 Tax=Streptomyces tubercidicus TaxID=47759 RepID=A0A640UM48_9ACTN|nr:hypothetical protein Stube_03740 [Streptomyces tubercidicus]